MADEAQDIKKELVDEETNPEIKEMIEAGVFFGRKKSHTHPKMKPYILHNRNGIEIINLHKTLEVWKDAEKFLESVVARGGAAMLVVTQPAFEDLASAVAKEMEIAHVVKRWLGGALTNFRVISKRTDYFKRLKTELATGGFDKYTKKEKLEIEKEKNRMTDLFGGLESLTKIPDVLIIIDATMHSTAVREAKHSRIPVIAFVNVDSDPDELAYPVVGNNKGRASVNWFLDKVKAAVLRGREIHKTQAIAEAAQTETVKQ